MRSLYIGKLSFLIACSLPLIAGAMWFVWRLDRRASRAALNAAVLAILAVWVAAVLILTLPGIDPQTGPRHLNVIPFRDSGNARDLLGNVGMFLPLGVFLAFIVRRPTVTAAAVGLLVSATIELVQYLENEGRSADMTDVLLNVAGACIGAFGCSRIRRHARRSLSPGSPDRRATHRVR